MTAIGAYDAKSRLPKLLERVGRGERFLNTKHGHPVAQLVPAETTGEAAVIDAIREMQKWQEKQGPTLGSDLTIGELREAGRRF